MNRSSIKYLLQYGKEKLKESGIETYSIDSLFLLMNASMLNKVQIITGENLILSEDLVNKFNDYINKRCNKMPVQYIINKCEFMSIDFYVDENVLIPRADTEILVEECINTIKEKGYKNILEIGTGSGCIGISLAYYCNDVIITSADISKEALDIASRNAVLNNVNHKINFVESDLFDNIIIGDEQLDLVISNPPYIIQGEIETLEDNVKKYEPYIALDGGIDGLYFYREISKKAYRYLKYGGTLAFEIGCKQAEDVISILQQNRYRNIRVLKDLSCLDRVITCIK